MHPAAARRLADATLDAWSRIWAAHREGHPADRALQELWREHRHYGSRDRRFISATVFSSFRWHGWLRLAELEPGSRLALAYFLDAAADHPAARALLDDAGPIGALSPAGALDLAGKARWFSSACGSATQPEVSALFPDWLADEVEAAHLHPLQCALQQRPPLWLRCPASNRPRVQELLRTAGFESGSHPRLRDAIQVAGSPAADLMRSIAELGGQVQDLASQAIGHVCAAQPGEQWWDCCAGAGGKTLHLAEQLNGSGRVLATDLRTAALAELVRRARHAGLERLITRQLIREEDGPGDARFDGILVDAPCSGSGTWHRNPDARWRTNRDDVLRYVKIQSRLLERAARHLKPRGRLIYATCSITRSEGEQVIASFLKQRADMALAPYPHPLNGQATSGMLTLWPHEGPCNGMFLARLHSRAPTR